MPNENTTPSVVDTSNVSARDIVTNKELRQLRPGSDEFNAAVSALSEAKRAKETTPAVVTDPDPKDAKVEDPAVVIPVGDAAKVVDDKGVKKPHAGVQKRIDELTKAQNDEKRRADDLQAKLDALEKTKVADKVTTVVNTKVKDGEPNFDDFANPQDFYKAYAKFEAAQSVETFKRQAAHDAQMVALNKQAETFLEKGASIEKERGLDEGEFRIIATDPAVAQIVAAEEIRQEFFTDPNGHQMLMDILLDDAVKDKFSKLNIPQKLVYLGKLSAKYENAASKNAGTSGVSKAKAPPPSKMGGGSVKVGNGMPDPKVDRKGWERWRNEQRKASGKGIT